MTDSIIITPHRVIEGEPKPWTFTPKFSSELTDPRPVMDHTYKFIVGEHGKSKSGGAEYIWYNRPMIRPTS